jgi:hypothetical protein
MSPGKILFSVVAGFFSPIVYIMGAEPFEVRGENSVQEVLAGCIAVALYLAVCQFLAVRNSGSGFRANWPILAAMVAPLLAICLIMVGSDGFLILLAGCIGSLAGSVAGHLGPRTAPNRKAAWQVVLRAGAGLYLVVAAILVVVVIPAVARDTSPHATPGPAVKAFIVSVTIHVSVAAFMLWRTRGGKLPVVAGVFGLLLGLALFEPAAAFAQGGPAMRLAGIALWACTGIDFLVGAASLAAAAMVREPELEEGELRFP